MKFEGTRPSGKDKDIEARIFSFGKEELRLLYALILSAQKYTPRTIETISILGRLRNFAKVLREHIK